jgi:hypothetical protein
MKILKNSCYYIFLQIIKNLSTRLLRRKLKKLSADTPLIPER